MKNRFQILAGVVCSFHINAHKNDMKLHFHVKQIRDYTVLRVSCNLEETVACYKNRK